MYQEGSGSRPHGQHNSAGSCGIGCFFHRIHTDGTSRTAHRVDWISNGMGRRVTDVGALGALIDAPDNPALNAEWETPDGRALLASGLGPRYGRLAADRIIDVWEERLGPGHDGPPRL